MLHIPQSFGKHQPFYVDYMTMLLGSATGIGAGQRIWNRYPGSRVSRLGHEQGLKVLEILYNAANTLPSGTTMPVTAVIASVTAALDAMVPATINLQQCQSGRVAFFEYMRSVFPGNRGNIPVDTLLIFLDDWRRFVEQLDGKGTGETRVDDAMIQGQNGGALTPAAHCAEYDQIPGGIHNTHSARAVGSCSISEALIPQSVADGLRLRAWHRLRQELVAGMPMDLHGRAYGYSPALLSPLELPGFYNRLQAQVTAGFSGAAEAVIEVGAVLIAYQSIERACAYLANPGPRPAVDCHAYLSLLELENCRHRQNMAFTGFDPVYRLLRGFGGMFGVGANTRSLERRINGRAATIDVLATGASFNGMVDDHHEEGAMFSGNPPFHPDHIPPFTGITIQCAGARTTASARWKSQHHSQPKIGIQRPGMLPKATVAPI
jgi:hypothetical protein